MKGEAIFLAFFVFFTVATLAVPIPLFPGNMVHSVFSSSGVYTPLFDAVANGILYGFIIWIAYVLVSRKLEAQEATINPSTQVHSADDHIFCPVHFGYLRNLPPHGSVLEECYSCSRLEQCFSS